MDWKRTVLAVVVVFVLLVLAGYLIHAVWLASTYQSMRADGFSFRTPEAFQHRIWIIWLSDLVYAILFVWVYLRGRENKPWAGQGVRYGVLMTFFTLIPNVMQEYTVYNIAHMLALKWMVAGGIVLIIAGILVALICQTKTEYSSQVSR